MTFVARAHTHLSVTQHQVPSDQLIARILEFVEKDISTELKVGSPSSVSQHLELDDVLLMQLAPAPSVSNRTPNPSMRRPGATTTALWTRSPLFAASPSQTSSNFTMYASSNTKR